jgi:CRISPR-associated protein Cas1
VVIEIPDQDRLHVPLHHLGALGLFGNVMVSPFLLARCAEDGRAVSWFTTQGRFQARMVGPTAGNVLLRKAQHDALSDPNKTLLLAQAIVAGKVRNARHVVQRALRDGSTDDETLRSNLNLLNAAIEEAPGARDVDGLRGIEGNAAAAYFACLPGMLRTDSPALRFPGRQRRPPRDPVNALLSFAYTLMTSECVAALEGVGLDPQVGYLHALRPGRPALGLDLLEEFRHPIADRAVLTLINRGQLTEADFETRPGGAVLLTDAGRRTFLRHWRERKEDEVRHDLLDSSVPIGLLPHIQARILARAIRGEIPEYAPFSPH